MSNLTRKMTRAPGYKPSRRVLEPIITSKPDKGDRDGSCNRSSCQRSLKDLPRFSMRGYNHEQRIYYCPDCAELLNEFDVGSGTHPRCTITEADQDG